MLTVRQLAERYPAPAHSAHEEQVLAAQERHSKSDDQTQMGIY